MDCLKNTSTEHRSQLLRPPKYIKYQLLQSRLESFIGWPSNYVPKSPEELAEAGFFYIGSADRVTCFQCGITLRDWEEEHNPIVEHRKYSENCQYVNRTDLKNLGVQERTVTVGAKQVSNLSYQQVVTSPESNTAGDCTGALAEGNKKTSQPNSDLASVANSSIFAEHSGIQASETGNSNGHLEYEVKQSTVSNGIAEGASVLNGVDHATEQLRSSGLVGGSPKNPLHTENKKLRAQMTCRLCKTTGVNTVFLPCGHLVTCSECALRVVTCVVCSKLIAGTVKTFMT